LFTSVTACFIALLTHHAAVLGQETSASSRTIVEQFVAANCLDCHAGDAAEADLRLDEADLTLTTPDDVQRWVRIYDRVERGEMPPAGVEQPSPVQRSKMTDALRENLLRASRRSQATDGRVQLRRLNRVQFETILRDLLALPHLEVAEMLPPDDSAHGFDNVSSALQLSFVHLSRYLDAADAALEKSIVLAPRPDPIDVHLEARSNGRFAQVLRKAREAVPVGTAVGLLRQPNTAQAPWWWSKVAPPVDGTYRIRMKSFGFMWDKGSIREADRSHVLTFHAVQGTTKRPLGSFDVGPSPDDPTVHDFTAFLRQGDQIQIWIETLDDRNKGQRELSDYTAPGVALDWLEVSGPLSLDTVAASPLPASYHRLFGELPVTEWSSESGLREPALPMIVDGVGKRAKRVPAKRKRVALYHVDSSDRSADARRLLNTFAERAFRRPTSAAQLEDIVELVEAKLEEKYCFQEAMQVGFEAMLCSPEFLFLQEQPGLLDDYALATRLSLLFWNSLPDDVLLQLAASGKLHRSDELARQVNRMLDDPRSKRFIESFCGQWLDLRRISVTQPDEVLYPEYDELLLASMVKETEAYFAELIREDCGVAYLVDSDFAMVNERLARLYDIPGVQGVRIRRVALPTDSSRGGLLTQASILKVTANGTTTSPVTRGAWILDRLYGTPAALPPANVPAVEPDLRGTTTIRQQLQQHRNDESCATCHRRIDPPGFALENFDVIGGWRDRYRSLGVGDIVSDDSISDRPVRYRLGLPVDASGIAPGGQTFRDINGFRQIMLSQQEQLARNMAERLLVYATGAGVQFADRVVIEDILAQTQSDAYGLRSLIHAVVQSPTFRSK